MKADLGILVPTKGRAKRLSELASDIRSNTEIAHRIYFILEDGDHESIEVTVQLPTVNVLGEYGSCAKAVNAGYHASSEPFIAIVNDDCKFHPSWDWAALAHFSDDVHVVGLNDGSGDCKCFHMVRREFIRQHSGVYDKPDTVYHEGYRSQCVDTEFSHYAQLRGVWEAAPDSIVEHVHWRFGKADPDHPNYEKARASNKGDIEEYRRRQPEWDPGLVTPPCVPGGVMKL